MFSFVIVHLLLYVFRELYHLSIILIRDLKSIYIVSLITDLHCHPGSFICQVLVSRWNSEQQNCCIFCESNDSWASTFSFQIILLHTVDFIFFPMNSTSHSFLSFACHVHNVMICYSGITIFEFILNECVNVGVSFIKSGG